MSIILEYDLMDAIRKGNLEKVRNLLEKGTTPDAFSANDTYGYYSNALILSARYPTPGIMEALLSYKPKNLECYEYNGMGALHYAVLNKNWNQIDALLKAGVSIDANGGSAIKPRPLHTAIEHDLKDGETHRTAYLLERGADPFLLDGQGKSAFIIAPAHLHDLLAHHAQRTAEARRLREVTEQVGRIPPQTKIKHFIKRNPK